MNVLMHILYLILICMILLPFVGMAVGISTDIYFKNKTKFITHIAAGLAKGLEEYSKNAKGNHND